MRLWRRYIAAPRSCPGFSGKLRRVECGAITSLCSAQWAMRQGKDSISCRPTSPSSHVPGGHNAGHTVYATDQDCPAAAAPAFCTNRHLRIVTGGPDPQASLRRRRLGRCGYDLQGRLLVSERASSSFSITRTGPFVEARRGERKIGTTSVESGPNEDKIRRRGIRVWICRGPVWSRKFARTCRRAP